LYNAEWSVRGGLARRDFTEFTRADSQKQLAYKGWPLYTSDSDTRPGHTTSDGMEKLWHAVATPFYTVIIRRSTVAEADNDAGAPYSYTYLADGAGRSLYMFWHDTPADGGPPTSGCSRNCIRAWPPTEVGNLKIVSSLSRADFDALTWTPIQRDGGPPPREIDQLVFKGWPIYYWWRDYVPGDTTGHCAGDWSLAEIDGDFITEEECALP
jgi:predicted lipoprotein with Yx(FWY)xxD motif